jgi:hypothetical protein
VLQLAGGRTEGADAPTPALRAVPSLPDAGGVPDEAPPPPVTDADAVL